MIFIKLFLLLLFIVVIFYIFSIKINMKYKYINYFYILKFVLFYIIMIIYYIIYLFIYLIFFIFKNFRFFSYYFDNINTAFYYYNKKSIYFLFWRYLVISIVSIISLCIVYLLNIIKSKIKNYYFINNIYIYIYIYIKILIYNNNSKILFILNKFYNIYIYILSHLFYFFNIDENFVLISKLQLNIFNILQYVKDPLLNRNTELYLFNKYYNIYKNINNNIYGFRYNLFIRTSFYFLKKLIFSFFIYICLFINSYNDYNNVKLLCVKFYILFNIKKDNIIVFVYKTLKVALFYINILLINIIFNIILSISYLFYFIFIFFNKIKYILLLLILSIILIKYYYLVMYYFFLLYKHYTLNLPLLEIKQSLRFFNFEWIDLRNYFNLIFLHNSLVPLIEMHQDNIIYNDLWVSLNKNLSIFGFKVNHQYDIQLHSLLDIRNNDTVLLDNIFKNYNKKRSYSLLKWYIKMKKKIALKAKSLFQYHKKKRFLKKRRSRKFLVRQIKNYSSDIHLKNVPYFDFNRERLFRNNYKKIFKLWMFFHKKYFVKKRSKFVSPCTSNFIRLNKIPLRVIYIFNHDYYVKINKNINYYAKISRKYIPVITLLKRHTIYLALWLKKIIKRNNYNTFFNHIVNFEDFKSELNYKHKIPTFQWNTTRWRRKLPNHLFYNPIQSLQLHESQSWYTHYELKRKRMRKKRMYRSFFMRLKYPYKIHLKVNITESLGYSNILNSYTKIIKKFYYIKGLKKNRYKKYYKHLFYKLNLMIRLYLFRFNSWDKPFYKKQLGNIGNNFWYFFDYLKTDKYYNYKSNRDITEEDYDVNLLFIKRIRKDYVKLRNYLLRFYSLYYRYSYLERPNIKHYYYARKLPYHLRKERAFKNYESFRTKWFLKLYFSKEKNVIKTFKKVKILSKLFKKKFYAYFIYCDHTINSYNDLYYIKIKSYKLKVLNKINNLKRFFHFQNKNINGWSFLKYLYSFSFSYHIKRFLWHSPYSFLLYNNKLSNHGIINNMHFVFDYKLNNNNININKYSIIFNLFINSIEIKTHWYLLDLDVYYWIHNKTIYDAINKFYRLNPTLSNAKSDKNFYFNKFIELKWNINKDLAIKFFNEYEKGFKQYYFNEHDYFILYYNKGFNLKTFYSIDIYRFAISFLFEYYKNFLYRLTRYRYIIDMKQYDISLFLRRYFNLDNFKHYIYIRLRLLIYKKMFFGRFLKKKIKKYLLPFRNLYASRIYRKDLVPFWFLYDYYIKLFIYFLLNKFYIQNYFIFYWLFKNEYISIYNLFYLNFIYINNIIISQIKNIFLSFHVYKSFLYILFFNYYPYFISKLISIFYFLFDLDFITFLLLYNKYADNIFINSQSYYQYFNNIKIKFINYFFSFLFKEYPSTIIKTKFFNYQERSVLIRNFFSFLYFIYNNGIIKIQHVQLFEQPEQWPKHIEFKPSSVIIILLFYKIHYDKSYNRIDYYYVYPIFDLLKHFKLISSISLFNNNIYILLLLLKNYIELFILNLNYNYMYLIFEWIIKNKDLLLKLLIIKSNHIIEFNININKLILVKIYLSKCINFYIKTVLHLKNTLKFFKSNYMLFRNQRGNKRRKKIKAARKAFLKTVSVRNIYSFRHLTKNISLFRNLYLTNIYNYIYVYNNNINSIFNLFFPLFKYKNIVFNIFVYLLLYFSIFIILFLYYKKFYNLFIFCDKVNIDPQNNWDTIYNLKQNTLINSRFHNKRKNKILQWISSKNKKFNFYNFYIFNGFLKNTSIYENYIYKNIISNPKYNGLIYCNNNELVENSNYIKTWPITRISKYFDFLKNIVTMPFKLKLENKNYNFYFFDLLNLNLFNFCYFYWFLLIPYFFFEFILMKYHLRGHTRIRRRITLLIKLIFHNFKWFMKIFKLIGRQPYSGWKMKHPKSYKGIFTRHRKKLKHGFYFKWERYSKTLLKITGMGSYYSWFFKINRYEYFISFYKYWFNFSFKTNYFYYIYIYILLLFIINFKYIRKKKCILV